MTQPRPPWRCNSCGRYRDDLVFVEGLSVRPSWLCRECRGDPGAIVAIAVDAIRGDGKDKP